MKVVINRCFGGFSLPKQFCDKYGFSKYDYIDRADPRLVAFVEENEKLCKNFNCASLAVVEVPEEATDWQINEYDGSESIVYTNNKANLKGATIDLTFGVAAVSAQA